MISIDGEIHSSKNSRRILVNRNTGKPFVAKSKVSKADEESFSWQLASKREAWLRMTDGLSYPFTVVFQFRRATKHRFDYVNIAQGILDAMVEANYMPDDSADYVIPVFLPYVINKDNPGCNISVLKAAISNSIRMDTWREE